MSVCIISIGAGDLYSYIFETWRLSRGYWRFDRREVGCQCRKLCQLLIVIIEE